MIYDAWNLEYEEHKEEYLEVFDRCMSTNNIEKIEFPKFNRKYGVPVASATDALQFSLMCHDIGPGDEVLVSDFSWISSASCISMVGATPVFCDINLETYTLSLDSIQRMTSDKTKALVYTHLFGNISDDVVDILNWCKENNIIFIEDAAQSLGAYKNDIIAGTLGDCSSFSFNSNKVIAGINGGGVFLTDNKEDAKHVEKCSRHGRGEFLGRNSKAYLLNTEIIKLRLKYADEYMKRRQEIAKKYDNSLEDVITQKFHEGHNYHKYVIRVEDKLIRDNIVNQTKAQIHYPLILSNNKCFGYAKKDDIVNAQIASETVVSLPIHPWLTDEEIYNISNMVNISLCS